MALKIADLLLTAFSLDISGRGTRTFLSSIFEFYQSTAESKKNTGTILERRYTISYERNSGKTLLTGEKKAMKKYRLQSTLNHIVIQSLSYCKIHSQIGIGIISCAPEFYCIHQDASLLWNGGQCTATLQSEL